MVITTQDIINSTFKKLGILGRGETLSADDSQDAKRALNLMLASWSIRNVATLVTAKDELTLIPNQRIYTIGITVGADFNTPRPKMVFYASLEDENQFFRPIDVISDEQYSLYGDRLITIGVPNRMVYEATLPNGTITLYFIPDKPYILHIDSQKAFAEITALDAEFDLDEAYLEAIIYNLAVRLAPDYGIVPAPSIAEAANSLFDTLLGFTAPDMSVFLDVSVRRPRTQTIYSGYDP